MALNKLRKETARIRIHRISECGYYPRGSSQPVFGSVADVLRDLERWIVGNKPDEKKKLSETSLEDLTYCCDIRSNSFGDYFVTTWNRTSDSIDITSIEGSKPVGESAVNLLKVPEGYIPGFATYFWIIPSMNKIATIKFSDGHRKQGLPEFRDYILFYMRNLSGYCIHEKSNDSEDLKNLRQKGEIKSLILGYADLDSSTPERLHAKFDTKFYENIDRGLYDLDLIRQKRSSIRKILRKTKITEEDESKAAFLDGLMSLTGLANVSKESRTFRLEYGLNFPDPSQEELDDILTNWQDKTECLGEYENLGFQIKEDDGKLRNIWVDSLYSSKEFELETRRDKIGLIAIESLEESISNMRRSILSDLGSMPASEEALGRIES